MKNLTILFIALWYATTPAMAHSEALREKVGVLYIDTKNLNLSPAETGQLVRVELDKLDVFEVLDQYDIAYIAQKEQINMELCFGKTCLVEAGKKLGADKMLSGSIEVIAGKLIVSLRLLNVNTQSVERSRILEFLDLRPQIQLMIRLSLQKLLDLPVDTDIFNKLTLTDQYESAINHPQTSKLNLNGPRMGATIFTGDAAARISDSRNTGGVDGVPVMFQFGYQFETTYLNQGKLQALFEFIPIVTGLDQGLVIPSLTILHGLRSNYKGWEFAFGPSVSVTTTAEGFYDNGKWTLLDDWKSDHPDAVEHPDTRRLYDYRGEPTLTSSFVFAFGKSFKSGKLNIPVNLFVIPQKSGTRFGLSAGFNGKG